MGLSALCCAVSAVVQLCRLLQSSVFLRVLPGLPLEVHNAPLQHLPAGIKFHTHLNAAQGLLKGVDVAQEMGEVRVLGIDARDVLEFAGIALYDTAVSGAGGLDQYLNIQRPTCLRNEHSASHMGTSLNVPREWKTVSLLYVEALVLSILT